MPSYESVRGQLSAEYAGLPDSKIESTLRSRNIDPEMMEGFLSDLGKFASSAGQAVLKAAPSVLPVAGQVLGTVVGGPAGAALGGKLGSLAGGAIGAATGQAPGAAGGSPAAGQLLQTVLKPETMQALMSMALGPLGKQNISVAGKPVPVSAFSNLLGVLAGRAGAEYEAAMSTKRGAVPEYMTDYAGEPTRDPARPESRAEALYDLLEFSQAERDSAESSEAGEADSFQAEMDAIQAEYDALELQELYESEEY